MDQHGFCYAKKAPKSKFQGYFSPTWAKKWQTFGEELCSFSSFNFQEIWPQDISPKNPGQIPHALKDKSFTARLWELGSEVVQEPLPLKPGILVKESVGLVERKKWIY